jgi:hypothetical protein
VTSSSEVSGRTLTRCAAHLRDRITSLSTLRKARGRSSRAAEHRCRWTDCHGAPRPSSPSRLRSDWRRSTHLAPRSRGLDGHSSASLAGV